MLALELLAERRIAEALAQGAFDDLPGAGRPLPAEDDALVPEELRLAWRVLKNAGFVPPQVEARRSIAELERTLLAQSDAIDDAARARAERRLALLRASVEPRYAARVTRRFAR